MPAPPALPPVPEPPPTPTGRELDTRLTDVALEAVVTVDHVGRIVQFNPAAEAVFGWSREEVVGRPLPDLLVPEELRAAWWAGLLRYVAEGDAWLVGRREVRRLRRDGQEFPAELRVTKIADDPLLLTGLLRDLSEVRAAEDRGARTARRLDDAEELAGVGHWELDLAAGGVAWSRGWDRIVGAAPGASAQSLETLLDHVHPAHRERTRRLVADLLARPEAASREAGACDLRVVRPDGEIRELRARGRVEVDDRGRPARWVASGQDVTDERQAGRLLEAHWALERVLGDWHGLDEGLVALLEGLGRALELPLGTVWIPDAGRDALRPRASWTDPERIDRELAALLGAGRRPYGEGLAAAAWRARAPVLAEDRARGPAPPGEREPRDAELALPGGLAFPAVGGQGPVAVLSFHGPEPGPTGEPLVRTLAGLGHELGRFLARRRGPLHGCHLSPRELEVLRLAAEGLPGPEIAARLVVSPATVKTHFEHVYEKLGVSDRAGAVARALRLGLIA